MTSHYTGTVQVRVRVSVMVIVSYNNLEVIALAMAAPSYGGPYLWRVWTIVLCCDSGAFISGVCCRL